MKGNLHVCWDHNRDLFAGHSSSQTTHQTGRWKYQEQLEKEWMSRGKATLCFTKWQICTAFILALVCIYLALQVLASELGVVEVAAGVAVVVADMATAEVAGAEMVADCTVCKVLYKYTPAVNIRDTVHGKRSHGKVGQSYLRGWLADDMGLINLSTLRDDHCSSCRQNFHSWSGYTHTQASGLMLEQLPKILE